jgi:hypothetical protein
MNEQESQSEGNLERLIRASCGPETRSAPLAREQLHQRLSAALREKRRPAEFPAGCLILLLAATSVLPLWNTSVRPSQIFELNPVGGIALVNLACLPIASLVIILRRKHV